MSPETQHLLLICMQSALHRYKNGMQEEFLISLYILRLILNGKVYLVPKRTRYVFT